jgi:chromosome segregation ATPase
MSSPPQFLVDFQNSMTQLDTMNKKVQVTLAEKNRFNKKLQDRLQKINQMIQQLASVISNLKSKVDSLQGAVNTNSASIGNKDKEIADLTKRLSALEAEKQQLTQNLTALQTQANNETTALQQKIDTDEAQIRQLTNDNTLIKNKSDALEAELASKGDLPAQHAAELKKQTDDFQAQLAKQQQDNQLQIDQLMAQIKDREDQMAALQKQLQDKTAEADAHVKNITDTQNKGQAEIDQLNKQIAELQAANDDLVQRIIAATQAIMLANENLRLLSETAPNMQSEKEVDNLLDEIQNSIQTISNAIQGNPTQSSMYSSNKQNKVNIDVLDDKGQRRKIDLDVLRGKLTDELNKARTTGNPGAGKLEQALIFLRSGDNNALSDFLNNSGFRFYKNSNKMIFGGKKRTKKHRKQKGGYTYKANIKRRSVPTSSRGSITRSSKSRTTNRSSKQS